MRGLRPAATRRFAAACCTALVASLAASGAAAVDLAEVYRLALQSDPVYLASGSANRAAQELRPQARALLLPNVQGQASITGTDADIRRAGARSRPSFNSDELALTVTQPIYRQDLLLALEQSTTRVERADVVYAAARQDLMVRVTERYFAVLQAIDELSFAQATLDAFGQQLKQSQQRFEVGLIAVTDVEEAKAGHDRARADVIGAENTISTTTEALREITGTYHELLAGLDDGTPLVVPEPRDIDRWTETSLVQNLSLSVARLDADSARFDIKRAEAGHLPSINLVGSHQRSYTGSGINPKSNVFSNSIGLQLSLPIYEGGLTVSRTRETQHLHRQALDQYEQVRRSAQRQTREAYFGVESGISQVQALDQAVRSAESAKEAIEAGFQVGTRTSVDVLDADRELFRARRDHAAARYRYILDIVRLKQAAGTLSEDDLEQINTWLQ